MKTDSDLSILVLSSDTYQPIPKAYDFYFKKHWADCPFKAYTVSNHNKFESDSIECLVTGIDWDENANHFKPMVLHALNEIKTKYVLFMVEDQILVKDVITDNFHQAIEYMDENDITKLRCLSMPEPDEELTTEKGIINNKYFGLISKDNMYRNSLQAAIWNRENLKELLNSYSEPFSGWVLESTDSFREYSKKWNYVACRHGKGGDLLTRDLFEGQEDSPLLQYVELVRWGVYDRIYIDFFREKFSSDGFSVDTPEYERFGAGKPKEWFPE